MKIVYAGNLHNKFGCEYGILKALKKTEHEIIPVLYPTYQENYDKYNQALIKSFNQKPDIVIVAKAMGLTCQMILDLKEKYNVPIVQWTFDHMGKVNGENRWAWWSKQAPAFDLTFNSEDCMHDFYLEQGINHRIIRQGYDSDVFKPFNCEVDNDVIFTGHPYNDWRKLFINMLQSHTKIRFKHYNGLYMADLNKEANKSRIAINTNYNDKEDRGWSNRIAESMGMGLMVVSPHLPSMDKEGFKDRENIVYYKTHDVTDLVKKISYYLLHPKEREQIAQKGYELAKKTMTWDIILQGFLDECKKEGLI